MKAFVRKVPGALLIPDDQESSEALKKMKTGDVIAVEWHHPRNYNFHKKFFAMLKLGFDSWEPQTLEHKGMTIEKNFDRFREDIIIAAGFYDVVINLRGEARAKAKSISFGSMSEQEFGELYNKAADVLLNLVLKKYTRDDLDRVVQELMNFSRG